MNSRCEPAVTPLGRLMIERSFTASPEEIWDLWTTPSGLEAWWGPSGFQVTVQSMDVRPGGELRYSMAATSPDTIAFLQRSAMAATTQALIIYGEVFPFRRLSYSHRIDFVPGVDPYDVSTEVDLLQLSGETRMVISFDRHHDELWTERARMGWDSQIERLAITVSGVGRP